MRNEDLRRNAFGNWCSIRAIISGAFPITRAHTHSGTLRRWSSRMCGRNIEATWCDAVPPPPPRKGGRGYRVTPGPGESLDPGTNKRGGPRPYLRLTGFIRIRNEGIARSTLRCTWREPEKGSRFPATRPPTGCTPTRNAFGGYVRHIERRHLIRETLFLVSFLNDWWNK